MKTLIFPGWASFESFYQKELKEDFFYVNSINKISIDEEVNIVAWSMGTLKALKFIKNNKVNKLILLAPTKRFTENIEAEVIDKMIEGLKINKEITLKNFYKMNFKDLKNFREFWNDYENKIKKLEVLDLIKDLEFLKNEEIKDLDFTNVKEIHIFYDKEDRIIPINEEFLSCGYSRAFSRGHNFIYKNEELKDIVRSLLND